MEGREGRFGSPSTLQKSGEQLRTSGCCTPKITIVGAGMSGLLMTIYLHRRGYRVDLYERRPDLRRVLNEQNRSINMTLSLRGLEVLRHVGLDREIERIVIPLKGRVIHTPKGTMFQPYGKNDHEVLYGVKRNDLNVLLLQAVEQLPNVTIYFEERLVRIDRQQHVLVFENRSTGLQHSVPSDVCIGADGTFSTVRQQMFRGERGDYHQEFLDWGYKELTIPVEPNSPQALRRDGLHVWARDHCMLIATANADHSFTCTCFMPFEGETSFSALQTEEQVVEYFSTQFQDLGPFIPFMVQSYMRNAPETLLTMRCAPWYCYGHMVLIGDACHSVYPFYGQGMNAALEDCRVLDECIGRCDGNWEAAFHAFQTARKRHTDALAELSKQHFLELSEKVNSRRFVARKKVDMVLNRLFPELWIPLYTLVSHTTMPYADAIERVSKRNRRANLLGLNVVIGLVATMVAMREAYTSLTFRFSGGQEIAALLRAALLGVVHVPPARSISYAWKRHSPSREQT
jgi:kynurenine 3-monooxygenase